MKRLTLLCAACAVLLSASVAVADEEEKVLFDQKYKLLEPNEKKEMGTYSIKAVEKGGEITITEEMVMQSSHPGRGKTGFKTKVKYKTKPALTPYHFEGETSMGDKTMMKGAMTVKDGKADLLVQGLYDRRGNPANPPLKMERKGLDMPKSALLVPRHLRVLGPGILDKPGELTDILRIEFPDDIKFPEFMNMKKGDKLVRDKPDEKGNFVIKLVSLDESGRVGLTAKFDSKGKYIDEPSSSPARLIEVPIERTAERQILKDLEKRLKETLKEACPRAEFALEKGRLIVQHKTKKFQVVDRSRKGGPVPRTYEELGPEETGFILRLNAHKTPVVNQLVPDQTLKREFWQTYVNAYTLEWKKEYYIWLSYSYGGKTDAKLLDAIKKTIADYTKKEK